MSQSKRSKSTQSSQSSDGSQRSYEGYRVGSIIRLHVENLMSYDNATFHPGPRLNVILGPNGTGKSALVCAMGLGLGLDPKKLGRGKSAHHFIKFGQQMALIEIDLYQGPNKRLLTVKREIYRGSSQWRLNKKKTTLEDVRERIAQLRVQVSSLCQFLPQDRVGEFSELDSKTLLKETEAAVGGDPMVQMHDELIAQGAALRTANESLQQKERIVGEKIEANRHLEQQVQQWKRRQELAEEAKLIEDKIPWVEFELARNRALTLHTELLKLTKSFKEMEKDLEPRRRKQLEVKERVDSLRGQEQQTKSAQRAKSKRRENLQRKILTEEGNYEALVEELDDLEVSKARDLAQMEKLRKEIIAHERNLEAMDDPAAAARELKEVQATHKSFKRQSANLNQQIQRAESNRNELERRMNIAKGELRALGDDVKMREEMMRRNKSRHAEAWQWIKNHRRLFKGEVTMMNLELLPKNPQAASYLERSAPQSLLCSVIVRNREDGNTIAHEWGRKRSIGGFTIVEVHESDEELERLAKQRSKLPDRAKQLGCVGYLQDMFSASPVALQALKQQNRKMFTGTAVGGPNAEKNLHELHKLGITSVFTPAGSFRTIVSRYDNTRYTTSVSKVGRARILVAGRPPEVRQKAEKELEHCNEKFQEALATVEDLKKRQRGVLKTMKELGAKEVLLSGSRKNKERIQKKIQSKKRMLENLEKTDYEQEEVEARASIDASLLKQFQLVSQLPSVMSSIVDFSLKTDGLSVERVVCEAQLEQLKLDAKEVERQLKDARHVVAAKTIEVKAAKKVARTMKKALYKKYGKLSEEQEAVFAALSDDLDELKSLLRDKKAAMDLIHFREDVVTEYNERKAEIEALESDLINLRVEQEEGYSRMEELRTKWLDGTDGGMGIRALVAKISEAFSGFMTDSGCKGEVVLREEEDRFEEYAIELRVAFREAGELKVLTKNVQSGGERSVSTMMYLLALQRLTPSPFRLVDEINQAMDEKNERKIWDLIVKIATEPGLPQYFLVTPKLLKGLTFTPDMAVFVVFNGYFNLTQQQWQEAQDAILEINS